MDQTLLMVVLVSVAVGAVMLMSWGFSGLFFKSRGSAGSGKTPTDRAAELERKNLTTKRDFKKR